MPLAFLKIVKAFNVIAIGYVEGVFRAFTFSIFQDITNILEISTENRTILHTFPARLRNLFGSQFEALYLANTIDSRKGLQTMIGYKFMKVVAKKINASLKAVMIQDLKSKPIGNMINSITGPEICLNSDSLMLFTNAHFHKKIDLFERVGYCALIPYPPKLPRIFFLLDPFDFWCWVGTGISLAALAFVWHLLNTTSRRPTNSFGYFIFGFFALFVGKAIPFRRTSLMQQTLLQLTTLLTFLLGNAYQSFVLSSFSNTQTTQRISSFDELLDSNLSIATVITFVKQINRTENYEKIQRNLVGTSYTSGQYLDWAETLHLKMGTFVIIDICSIIDEELKTMTIGRVQNSSAIDHSGIFKKFYKLDEIILSYPRGMYMSYLSYFYKTFQDFALRVLESGIMSFWKDPIPFEFGALARELEYYENEEFYMKLNELTPAFYILVAGIAFSLIAFLGELMTNFAWKAFGILKTKIKSRNNRVGPTENLKT